MKSKVLVTYTATHVAEVEVEHEEEESAVDVANAGHCEAITRRKLPSLDEPGWDWDVGVDKVEQ